MKKSLGLLLLAGALVVVATGASGCFGGTTTTSNTNTTANKNTATVNKNTNKVTANTNTAVANSNVNAEEEASSITIDKTSYAAGEEITVTYDIVETLKDGAWMGLVPSDTKHGLETDGDAADVDWQYLDGSTSGTMTFDAPADAGEYDVRVYDTEYEGGVEIGDYATFTVTE